MDIPSSILSSVLASVITFAGVFYAGWRNSKRIMDQRVFDSNEKERDRALELRKDVYLPVAEAITDIGSFFSTLPTHDFDKDGAMVRYEKFAAATTKLSMVSEPDTALLAHEILTEYSRIMMELIKQSQSVRLLDSKIAYNLKISDVAKMEMDRVYSQICKFNEEAQSNEIIFSALQKQFAIHLENLNKHYAENLSLSKQRNIEHGNYATSMIDLLKPMTDRNLQLLDAIRGELGQKGCLNDFREVIVPRSMAVVSAAEGHIADVLEASKKIA